MYNIYNTISELDLHSGETKRINCPNCGGYKTFTVTNNMGSLVWNCYKVSCGIKGSKKVHLSVDDIRDTFNRTGNKSVEKFELPPYVVERSDFIHARRFCDMWDIDFDTHGLMYDVKEDRVVFPVVHDGKLVDATGRKRDIELTQWYASHEPSPLVGGVELYIRFDDTTCASEDARFWLGRAVGKLCHYRCALAVLLRRWHHRDGNHAGAGPLSCNDLANSSKGHVPQCPDFGDFAWLCGEPVRHHASRTRNCRC